MRNAPTSVRQALEEAVRDFILHSRAVGNGQPKSYDNPSREGNHLSGKGLCTD